MMNLKKLPAAMVIILSIGLFFCVNKRQDRSRTIDMGDELIALAKDDKLEEIKIVLKHNPDSVEPCLKRMGCTLLREAAMASSLNTVKYLLTEKNLDINCDEGSALFYASSMGRAEMVQYLLQNGAKILPHGYSRENPLHIAAGSNPDLWVERDGKDFSKMDMFSVVKILIEHGTEVNVPDKNNETPLHKAAFVRNYLIVKYLIEQKAKVNSLDKLGNTPLHNATFTNKDNSICALLLKNGATPFVKNNCGKTPILWGCSNIDTSTIRLFVKYGYDPVNDIDNEENMLLHGALINGQFATIDYLLNHKTNINAATKQGVTPFHIAAGMRGSAGLKVIKKLIDAGADINAVDAYGHTPLYYISKIIESDHGTYFPDTLIVNYLREKGAR
jgi:ankyrin repeat protein